MNARITVRGRPDWVFVKLHCPGMDPRDTPTLLGQHLVWVGFTRIRKTMVIDNLIWIKRGFQQVQAPTRVALYDIEKRRCLREINLEQHRINILFSIQRAD